MIEELDFFVGCRLKAARSAACSEVTLSVTLTLEASPLLSYQF